MSDAVRVTFTSAVEAIESPAHLSVIAHHMLNGDLAAAILVAQVPSAIYAGRDAEILAAFAFGEASNKR